jgi:hypothetical protein
MIVNVFTFLISIGVFMFIFRNKSIQFTSACCVVAMLCTGIYYFLLVPKATQNLVEPQVQVNATNTFKQPQEATVKPIEKATEKLDFSKIDSSKPIAVDGKSYMLLSPKEVTGLKNWLGDHGYIAEEDQEVYNTYSDDVLKELGKNGDIMALQLLTNRAIKNRDKESAVLYMELGVIYGSTTELDMLTLYTRPQYPNDATEEQRRPAALETLALTQVIAKRGDRSLSELSAKTFLDSYKILYNVDLVLTSEEERFVSERSQTIYDQFQELRREKGLGDFDSDEPSGVKKFFGLQ